MSGLKSNEWRVEIQAGGQDGYLGYYEGTNAATFYWEFGGGNTVVIIHIGKITEWEKQYLWAADRRQEIIERIIQEVIRQKAPRCTSCVDVRDDGYTYLRILEQI